MSVNRFREFVLLKETFSITWELVPGRGSMEKSQNDVMAAAKRVAEDYKIHSVSITDNPGGSPAISAVNLGIELAKLGVEPLIHFTCKDKNRSQIESELYALARAGISNLLVMTGDYTSKGFEGRPKPVFDLDPVHILRLIGEMNDGLKVQSSRGDRTLAKTNFFAGAVVSPFKSQEAELIPQYFKLEKKVAAGAKFFITQLGYDMRKYHELLQYVEMKGWDIPVIANIYVLTYGAAKLMNAGIISGCVVTDELLAELEEEIRAEDMGREASLVRAAKMYAILKGMGYAGVHIGGSLLSYEDVCRIVQEGEELLPIWQNLVHEFQYNNEGDFYYFKEDPVTGLNSKINTDRSGNVPVKSLQHIFFRIVHFLIFNPKSVLFKTLYPLATSINGSIVEKPVTAFERWFKVMSNNCMSCGDCALLDFAYICPMSQCPKNQRNGPCGGSRDGWCEVYPRKKCFYVRVYERMKSYGEEDQLVSYEISPCNWDLQHTSSWLNFYLGRDHSAKRLGIKNSKED